MPVANVDQGELAQILQITSSGSLTLRDPETMTPGQRRQLRDAMIFEAHVREGRDIFVSNDKSAFIGIDDVNRRRLEATFKTRIMTVAEFCSHCDRLGQDCSFEHIRRYPPYGDRTAGA